MGGDSGVGKEGARVDKRVGVGFDVPENVFRFAVLAVDEGFGLFVAVGGDEAVLLFH